MSKHHPLVNWECTGEGCFLEKNMPDFSVFSNCFPERNVKINLTDIDGAVEVGRQFLFLEWKNKEGAEIPAGQRIFLYRLSEKPGCTVLVLWGERTTQNIKRMQVLRNGVTVIDQKADLREVRRFVSAWAAEAEEAKEVAS